MNLQPPPSKLILELFKKRNISRDQIDDFYSWNLKDLPDLENLHDLEKAAQRLIEGMKNDETIGIFGDYDVDGTSSCALFYQFFKTCHYNNIHLMQPNRLSEGYGLHRPSVLKSFKKKIKILVTVDCGITSHDAALTAKEVGIDLIITDHHEDAQKTIPKAYAVVNPRRRDEDPESPLRSIAGVTVAFIVCLKIKKLLERQGQIIPSIYPLLQYVAIGTICDLVHLNTLNLKLVRHGLKQLLTTQFKGLRSFFTLEELKRSYIPSDKLAFQIGPLINSKGRLEHPEKSLKLLIENDIQTARSLHSQLIFCNDKRKFIQAQILKEARQIVLKSIDHEDEHLISIVYAPHWHEGVIGIIASQLVKEFHVPAIVFTNALDKDLIKASARTAGSLNIFECLKREENLFLRFGGHRAAAGLTMNLKDLNLFSKNIKKDLKTIPSSTRRVEDHYDLLIKSRQITPQLVKDLERLEPFGQGNPRPKFKMNNFKIQNYSFLKERHVRWNLLPQEKDPSDLKLQGISFNYIDRWSIPSPEKLMSVQDRKGVTLHAYFTLEFNHFRGDQFIQLMVEKILFDG